MSDGHTLTAVIPLAVKPRGGRKAIITPRVMEVEARHHFPLIKAVAQAFRWLRMLESGRFATITELPSAEKVNSSYVSRILQLTLLPPAMVEAILDGWQPARMTSSVLSRHNRICEVYVTRLISGSCSREESERRN